MNPHEREKLRVLPTDDGAKCGIKSGGCGPNISTLRSVDLTSPLQEEKIYTKPLQRENMAELETDNGKITVGKEASGSAGNYERGHAAFSSDLTNSSTKTPSIATENSVGSFGTLVHLEDGKCKEQEKNKTEEQVEIDEHKDLHTKKERSKKNTSDDEKRSLVSTVVEQDRRFHISPCPPIILSSIPIPEGDSGLLPHTSYAHSPSSSSSPTIISALTRHYSPTIGWGPRDDGLEILMEPRLSLSSSSSLPNELSSTQSTRSSPLQSICTPAYPMPEDATLGNAPPRMCHMRSKKNVEKGKKEGGLPSASYPPLSYSFEDILLAQKKEKGSQQISSLQQALPPPHEQQQHVRHHKHQATRRGEEQDAFLFSGKNLSITATAATIPTSGLSSSHHPESIPRQTNITTSSISSSNSSRTSSTTSRSSANNEDDHHPCREDAVLPFSSSPSPSPSPCSSSCILISPLNFGEDFRGSPSPPTVRLHATGASSKKIFPTYEEQQEQQQQKKKKKKKKRSATLEGKETISSTTGPALPSVASPCTPEDPEAGQREGEKEKNKKPNAIGAHNQDIWEVVEEKKMKRKKKGDIMKKNCGRGEGAEEEEKENLTRAGKETAASDGTGKEEPEQVVVVVEEEEEEEEEVVVEEREKTLGRGGSKDIPQSSSYSSSSSPTSLPFPPLPTGGSNAIRHLMLQNERETTSLREMNARQHSMITTLKESLHSVQQQLTKQAEWFHDDRQRSEKERETQLENVMEQLRVVRHSAETLLGEKRGLVEENKRQQARLLHMVEQERQEKEHIMKEYRDKTEKIISNQGEEITRLRRKLSEVEEAFDLFKIQQIANDEAAEKLEEAHRVLLREKEELKGSLQKWQRRHQQETQERQEAEEKGRQEGRKDMEEIIERNRKLTQQLQSLEQQLQQQRRGHEAQEEKLLEAHRQERTTLEERLREVMTERDSAVVALAAQQQESTLALDQIRKSLEMEWKERSKEVKHNAERHLQDVREKWRVAEEEWEGERKRLQTTIREKDHQLQLHQMSNKEVEEVINTLTHDLQDRTRAWECEKFWKTMMEARHRLALSLLLDHASLHGEAQREWYEVVVVAPLRLALQEVDLATREREQGLHQVFAAERQELEEAMRELEKLLAELRVDRHRSQAMASQYLKELTVAHREKEQLRVQWETEVEKLEKQVAVLEQELQYKEMVGTEMQGTMKMLHGRLENYERENKSLHEEVLQQSQKLQEAHICIGRKDASINQLRAQLRAFESTSNTSNNKNNMIITRTSSRDSGSNPKKHFDLSRLITPTEELSTTSVPLEPGIMPVPPTTTGGEEGMNKGVEVS